MRLGRPLALTPEQIQLAGDLLPKTSVTAIAQLLQVSRSTLYAHVPELRARTAAAASTPLELAPIVTLVVPAVGPDRALNPGPTSGR